MEILQIVALGLVTAVLAVIVRSQRPELAILLSTAAGLIIFLLILGKVAVVISTIRELADRAGISTVYLGTVMKIAGIAYIAEFGAQVCRDAGEGTLAAKIELAAKVIILVLAVPIVVAVLQSLLKLVP